MRRHAMIAVAVLVAGVVSAWAQSGSLEDQLRQRLRDATDQVQTLQQEKAILQAQKVAAEQERDALRAEVAKLRGETGGASAQARAAAQAQIAQARAAAGQAGDALQRKEAERARAAAALEQKTALYDACVAKNADLYRTGMEILDAYQKFSLGDGIAAREPFVGLHRVALENGMQGYGDRLYDGQFDPRTVQTPAAPTQAAPAAQAVPPATATPQQQTSSSSDSSSQTPH